MKPTALYTVHASPLGELMLTSDGDALTGVYMDPYMDPRKELPEPGWVQDRGAFEAACAQLDAYFAGERTAFDLPLRPFGTAFQRRVWKALGAIPYGETRSYTEIAHSISHPRAVRAVGTANGRNPIPIIVPCHRVIGSDGSLNAYGGGIERKRMLLELEAEHKIGERA